MPEVSIYHYEIPVIKFDNRVVILLANSDRKKVLILKNHGLIIFKMTSNASYTILVLLFVLFDPLASPPERQVIIKATCVRPSEVRKIDGVFINP